VPSGERVSAPLELRSACPNADSDQIGRPAGCTPIRNAASAPRRSAARRVELGEDPARVARDHRADLGQLQPLAGRAHEDRRAERALQLGRLPRIRSRRYTGDATLLAI
jgi:hypothetical protein